MGLSRRDFLRWSGVTAVTAAATTGCSVVGRRVAQQELPEDLVVVPPPTLVVDPVRRFLDRAGYGPRVGDMVRVQQMGLAAYLEEQLAPAEIDDQATDLMLRNLNVYHMDVGHLLAQEKRDATQELMQATMLRAIYSKRQLYEAMVEFWSDHFNVYLHKNEFMPLLKVVDDRDVIRPHALGKFRDLLFASAQSQAMLVYLDNVRNTKESPNENYARELLELHTMGVHGGYSQQDVQEVARAFTGWTVRRRGVRAGLTIFDAEQHDFEEKMILGQRLPAGQGEEDARQVLEMLVQHPATARFVAMKLVRRFVADDPPAELVDTVARTYQESDGDIKSMLRVIFLSEQFATAPPKLKRPFTFMVSALRGLQADVRFHRNAGHWLRQLGQPLFQWPAPNGYPDVATAWTANLLPRWNFSLMMVHGWLEWAKPPLEELVTAGGVETSEGILNLFAGTLYGRVVDEAIFDALADYVGPGAPGEGETRWRLQDVVGLMLASPSFQWT